MILDSDKKVLTEIYTQRYDSEKYTAYWEGLLFIKSIPSGAESVRAFLESISKKGIQLACGSLSGNYCCFLHDKLQNTFYAFVDNDSASRLFYNNSLISSSFLKLIGRLRVSLNDINPYSVIEFVHSGRVLGNKTFFNNVNVLSSTEIFVASERGTELQPKVPERILNTGSYETMFLETFSRIVSSLTNRKCKLHLTGGGDTRLLAVLLKREGVSLDTFTVGVPGHPDIEIASRLAALLELNHNCVNHPILDEESVLKDLEEIFEFGDGLYDTFRLYQGYHTHQRAIHADADLVISGNGGELYKFAEWWSLRREARNNTIKRLTYTLQTGGASRNSALYTPHDIFSDKYKKHAFDYTAWLESSLQTMFPQGNGKDLADKIFEYSLTGDYRLPQDDRVLRVYGILLDRELVACANQIPAFDRFFSRFHQKITRSLNPAVSRMDITDPRYGYVKGMTWLYQKAKEKILFRMDALQKLARFSDKEGYNDEGDDSSLLKYDITMSALNWNNSLHDIVKHSHKGWKNIERLKKCGIIDLDITATGIDNFFIGRLYSLGELLKKMEL
jgi:hypothetical protein